MLLALGGDRLADQEASKARQSSPPAAIDDQGFAGGDQAPALAALELGLEGPHDAHVRVAGALAPVPFTDLEVWVDPV